MKPLTNTSGKNQKVYHLNDYRLDELERNLDSFFFFENYAFKSKQAGIRTYTKGDKTMRILLRALATYFEQIVIINKEEDGFSVCLPKGSVGIFGGLIGQRQVKKEFIRLGQALEKHLGQAPY